MNEELLATVQDETDPSTGDPTSAQDETAEENSTVASLPSAQERSDTIEDRISSDIEDPLLPEDPGEAPDPDSGETEADNGSTELEDLRRELKLLQEEIGRRDRMLERIGVECEEFRHLYPDVSLSSLCDAVWEDVHRGVPISAAYALSERKKQLAEKAALESNLQNAARSAGPLSALPTEYYSPAEVRAMSQAEVRANYQKIMKSIQQWH